MVTGKIVGLDQEAAVGWLTERVIGKWQQGRQLNVAILEVFYLCRNAPTCSHVFQRPWTCEEKPSDLLDLSRLGS